MAPHADNHDLENGNFRPRISQARSRNSQAEANDIDGLDEYGALVKYISTYRDPKSEQIGGDSGDNPKEASSRRWYQFWKKSGKDKKKDGTFVVPDEWVTTDISKGLSAAEVESRRAKTGYNEITTESENMFIKFLMYFTGPILYGNYSCCQYEI